MERREGRTRSAGGTGGAKYVLAVVALVVGLAVLGGGVWHVVARAAAPAELVQAKALTPPLSPRPSSTSTSAAPSSSPSASASAEPSPATSKTAAPPAVAPAVLAADVTFDTDAETGDLGCWTDSCWLWWTTADADCAAAQADVKVFRKGEDDAYRTETQVVGAFEKGTKRIVEVDDADDNDDHATVEVTCLQVDDGL